ncbi:hypothetical protein M8818_006017 [Zalaria obscura]|uniref:Uncharacterized protein n=1 Tax=Zalaria obscura TaxID=2024903 RepID=A0ACC3S6S1_9PEZI
MDYTGPQLAASPELFYTRFWRHRLLQAACYQPAILHAITALGALHEEMIRNARLGHQSPGPNMTFSLQQCNKAIHYILHPPDGRQTDPRVVLTTCLIFSTFYSIRGEIRAAIDQGLNVKRLLQRCLDAGPGPLDDTISIESLEPQARHVYMRARLGPDAVRAAVTRAMTVLRVDDPPNEADFRAHTITINSLEDAQRLYDRAITPGLDYQGLLVRGFIGHGGKIL